MQGIKALHLEAWCREKGFGFTRFDYRGHGRSSGDFIDCGIGDWRQDTLDILDRVAEGPHILVGSSMGLWIAVLAALARPSMVRGLVGIAGAPDFTERLIWDSLDAPMRARLQQGHVWQRPSEYDDGSPYPISYALVESGREWLLMPATTEPDLSPRLALHCPVRLLHGTGDIDVPWQLSEELLERMEAPDATLTLIKDADHRLSSDSCLDMITRTIEQLQAELTDTDRNQY